MLRYRRLSSVNDAADMICAADDCSMMYSENSTRRRPAGHCRLHGKNFPVLAARSFAAGPACRGLALRVVEQPDCNRNLLPFSAQSRGR